VRISQLQIKQFRCFNQFTLDLDASIILIVGPNGSGKTSLLEALYYACYLRSFRSSSPRELLSFDSDNFFIKVHFAELDTPIGHEVQVGFSGKKRVVKIDQKLASSYKELTKYYRVIAITEDDLNLIKGGPEERRAFLDQAIALSDPDFLLKLRTYKQILQNRNALLQRQLIDNASYKIWTKQLWEQTQAIQTKRLAMLEQLELSVNEMLKRYFEVPITIKLTYQAKKKSHTESLETFLHNESDLVKQERIIGRSLFGAHLDDILVIFKDKKSKAYASRGQQKLTIVLLKVAQLQELTQVVGPAVLLLDDFMTDFDPDVSEKLLEVLTNLSTQLIFTSPLTIGFFAQKLIKKGAQKCQLTI
jgi:DNA replication and repair protein RecF